MILNETKLLIYYLREDEDRYKNQTENYAPISAMIKNGVQTTKLC